MRKSRGIGPIPRAEYFYEEYSSQGFRLNPCTNISSEGINKANLRDLIAATGQVILLKLDSTHWFFIMPDLEIRWITLKDNKTPLLGHIKLLCIISKPSVNSNWSYNPEMLNSGQNGHFFVPCDLEIWQMTFKTNRAPLLCYFKLFASLHSHQSIQAGITVRKLQIWVKIRDFCSVWAWNLMDSNLCWYMNNCY